MTEPPGMEIPLSFSLSGTLQANGSQKKKNSIIPSDRPQATANTSYGEDENPVAFHVASKTSMMD
jgi:hypothetical protein